MKYHLLKEVVDLVEEFEHSAEEEFPRTVEGFKTWICVKESLKESLHTQLEWEGKENGRSIESVINTLIVHMNRYAKTYSKSAMFGSKFSTQEEFIFLIVLQANGPMSKMELINKNIYDKPSGMLIINRLINQGWIIQRQSKYDKRSKTISITAKGEKVLAQQMGKIRKATKIVCGNLNEEEKLELLRLLQKLDRFHEPIVHSKLQNDILVDAVYEEYFNQ